jgi:hypothetical protein
MKRLYVIFFISILVTSCGDSNQTGMEINNTIDQVELADLTPETFVDTTIYLDLDYLNSVFPEINDSLILIDIIDYNDHSYDKLDSVTINQLYQNGDDLSFPHYAIGRFNISNEFIGYLVGTQSYEGLYTLLWIFRKGAKKPANDFMYVAASVGDAGEYGKEKGWLVDLDNDGTLELLQRTGDTFLEIDANENERKTTIEDVEVWNFDISTGMFIQKKNIENLDQLNQQFRLAPDEL